MNKVFRIILIVLVMCLIFFFSSQDATSSSKTSDGLIIKVAEIVSNKELTIEEKENTIDTFVIPIRKLAHFTIYSILGITVINYLVIYNKKLLYLIIISILVCFVYACSDEVHQLFVPGRSGEVLDVFIDTVGGMCGILFYSMFYKNKIKM